MEPIVERVASESTGDRLDAFTARAAQSSRSAAQSWIEQGRVTVNGAPAGKNCKLKAGDCVHISIPEPVEYTARPEPIPLDVIYEDTELLVVNKPKGMVVHPAAGH